MTYNFFLKFVVFSIFAAASKYVCYYRAPFPSSQTRLSALCRRTPERRAVYDLVAHAEDSGRSFVQKKLHQVPPVAEG